MSTPATQVTLVHARAGERYDSNRADCCARCGQGYITTQGGIVTKVECRCGAINSTLGAPYGVCPECGYRRCTCPPGSASLQLALAEREDA
jgi:DNA-directed RNA polymerase subunit RPC12/RpoP